MQVEHECFFAIRDIKEVEGANYDIRRCYRHKKNVGGTGVEKALLFCIFKTLKWHLGGKEFFFFWVMRVLGRTWSKVVTMFKHLLGCNTFAWVLTLPNVMSKYSQPKSK
jgi:hypothetical protein